MSIITRAAARLAITLTIVGACLLGGCAINRASATADAALKWESIKSVHVQQRKGEDDGTKKLIAEKFKAKGYTVTADPDEPKGADAMVTYVDRWMWDLTMYMIELTVIVRDPKTEFPLARGNSLHTSLTRKSPRDMVDEVVENILKAKP